MTHRYPQAMLTAKFLLFSVKVRWDHMMLEKKLLVFVIYQVVDNCGKVDIIKKVKVHACFYSINSLENIMTEWELQIIVLRLNEKARGAPLASYKKVLISSRRGKQKQKQNKTCMMLK